MKRIIKYHKMRRPYIECFVCRKPASPNNITIRGKYEGMSVCLCDGCLARLKAEIAGVGTDE